MWSSSDGVPEAPLRQWPHTSALFAPFQMLQINRFWNTIGRTKPRSRRRSGPTPVESGGPTRSNIRLFSRLGVAGMDRPRAPATTVGSPASDRTTHRTAPHSHPPAPPPRLPRSQGLRPRVWCPACEEGHPEGAGDPSGTGTAQGEFQVGAVDDALGGKRGCARQKGRTRCSTCCGHTTCRGGQRLCCETMYGPM